MSSATKSGGSKTPDFRMAPLHKSGLTGSGVETDEDAAQYLLLGAHTVQVCTGVMIHGYKLLHTLRDGLTAFMDTHGFEHIDDFRGESLRYFTTHAELVRRQADVKAAERAAKAGMVTQDTAWAGDKFVEQSDQLVAND